MLSLLFCVLSVVAAIGSWSAYSSLVERLAAQHPGVYGLLGSPTRSMRFSHVQPNGTEIQTAVGDYIWKCEFSKNPGTSEIRILGWLVVVGQVVAASSLVLAFVL